MPKQQQIRIIDSRRSAAVSGGGVVLAGHTHDDRYYTDAEIAALLAGYLPVTGVTVGATAQAQTFTSGVIDSSLTASRLLASNGSNRLASVANLADWIAGTANQVTVSNDGDGSITLALPQNIHTAATPTFAGVIAPYLRPAADSTTALQLQNASGTAVLSVNTTAQTIGIGASPATNAKLVLSSANTSTSAEYGLNASVTSTPAGAMNSSHRVLNFTQIVNGSDGGSGSALVIGGDLYMSQTAGIWSFAASIDTSIRLTNAGSLTTAWGFGHEFRLSGAGNITTGRYFWAKAPSKSSTGVITTIQGFYASNLGLSGTTNSYAIYLENQTGSTNNYAVYTNAGLIRFGDTVTADVGLIVNESGRATGDLRAESDTEANMLFLDASADLLYLGGSTVGVKVAKGGNTTFLGDGSGLPYGSCYGNEIGWSQASAAQNTWYEVSDVDMSDGELNLVTHDGSGKLTVAVAGRYLINYTCSAEVSLPGKHVQSGISVSGTESAAGISHYNAATANEQFNVAGTAIIDLAANATIEMSLRTTDTGTPDISVDHLNITVVMVGGT